MPNNTTSYTIELSLAIQSSATRDTRMERQHTIPFEFQNNLSTTILSEPKTHAKILK